MKKNIQKYLSGVGKNTISYQWEDIPLGKSLRFDANTLPYPPGCLSTFLKKMTTNCPINEYSDPSYKKLRKLISAYENVSQNIITVTNSGDEAIDILAKTFLNPGEYFITTPPTYEMLEIQCGINKGRNMQIPLIGENFQVNADQIIKKSKNPKVKIIFLVNPNNPTGSVISQEVIERLVKNSDAIVVVDEVYREFYGETVVPLLKKYKNLIILRSFSKFAAMAGARIGYLIANKLLTEKFDSIRMPMGVSFFSYKLAECVLEKDKQWMKRQIQMIVSERKRLTDELKKLGFNIYPSSANFILVKIGDSASSVCAKLKEKGIIVRDRSKKKYLDGCVRITVRNKQENNLLIKSLKGII